MEKLVGSEKQVKWAESIRESYIKKAEVLRDVMAVYRDCTQVEYIDRDPIFGDGVRLEYTAQITPLQEAAVYSAYSWASGKKPEKLQGKIMDRGAELDSAGVAHPFRTAQAEILAEVLEQLEAVIATESAAKYWIDCR